MSISSFKELVVWQKSVDIAVNVYELTKQLPSSEQYGLINQMNRSAVSIASNIAEGQQRNNRAEFRQFIGIAKGSAAELETQLIIANRVYAIEILNTVKELEEVQKMLTSLSGKLK
jgi:four helix bundle protein